MTLAALWWHCKGRVYVELFAFLASKCGAGECRNSVLSEESKRGRNRRESLGADGTEPPFQVASPTWRSGQRYGARGPFSSEAGTKRQVASTIDHTTAGPDVRKASGVYREFTQAWPGGGDAVVCQLLAEALV
jgi:hypothetical protein